MNIKIILKRYLLAASIYLILDGLVHVFDIKLVNVNVWPESSLTYSKFIGNLYGGFAILAGLFGIEVQRDLRKYKNILYITAVWSLVYGAYLIYSGLTIPFVEIFSLIPSLYFWMPFYNLYLVFEAGLLFTLSILVYLFKRQND